MNTTSQQLAIVRTLFDEAERRGILLWLENGWAVDARLGEVTREHGDIDIVYSRNQEGSYRKLIETLGFDKHESVDYGFLSWRGCILLDSEPVFEMNGEYNFEHFPSGSCPIEKEGIIEDYEVRCVSWEAMYFEFLGYMDDIPQEQWRDKDIQSLRLIETHLDRAKKQFLKDLYTSSKQSAGSTANM